MKNEINEIDSRVLKLEFFKEQFELEIKEMKVETKILTKGLADINDSIKQIRNIVIGMFLTFIALQSGLVPFLKLLLAV